MPEPQRSLVAAYLSRLPEGIASYPDVVVKGTIVRSMIETSPTPLVATELPSELHELLRSPPLPTEWVPEVPVLTLMLAYQERIPEQRYDSWVEARNLALLANPLYRALFAMIGPERIYSSAAKRWGAFRRGTSVEIVEKRPHWVQIALSYPRHLHDAATLHTVAIAFRVTAMVGGASSSQSRVERFDATRADIVVEWR